jgi:hypothetical protein
MRLTILVPLLGSLLLFNHEVVEWAKISETAVRSWLNVPMDQAGEAARRLTVSRLQMLYLGLTVLGMAAGLFNWRCPPEIKLHGTNRSYQEAELPTMTKARTAMLLVKMGEPPAQGDLSINWQLVTSELTDQVADSTMIADKIRNASIPELARIARDLLALHYDTLLQNQPIVRGIISAAYLLGFALLLWPTGETFVKIVTNIVWSQR